MGNILYTGAAVLIIMWAIGFFAFNFGAIIHILLAMAVIPFFVKMISGNKTIS